MRNIPRVGEESASHSYSRQKPLGGAIGVLMSCVTIATLSGTVFADDALLGHWPLVEDAQDHSGHGRHGVFRGSDQEEISFDGRSRYVEIPASAALQLERGDFTIAAWVKSDQASTDMIGDIISKWDPATRKGLTLAIMGSAGGYNSHGTDRGIRFGIDEGKLGEWEDCGRPNPTSNYISNSLTVFDGSLYAATTEATTQAEWAHVYRYAGGQEWEDCGQVGGLKTTGVGPMIVHDSNLFAATWSYDWGRVKERDLDLCRVYRYVGGQEWEDIGQPGECRRIYSLATYKGTLYAVGDDNSCHQYQGDKTWKTIRVFDGMVHPMAVHDGKLYVGGFSARRDGEWTSAEVYSFDGSEWVSAGIPIEGETQLHAFHSYQGKLHVTTWKAGKVAALQANGEWKDCGRLGQSTEINGICVHNGMLYGGTIPHAEVFRYDGATEWTRIGRFCPQEILDGDDEDAKNRFGRVTSLTGYQGRLFAGVGSYTSSMVEGVGPEDPRGRIYSIKAGQSIAYDHDIGDQWRHVVAIRRGKRLELYLDGKLSASSTEQALLDLSNDEPLRIGFGPTDYFSGKIRDVRLWNKAVDQPEIDGLVNDRLRITEE